MDAKRFDIAAVRDRVPLIVVGVMVLTALPELACLASDWGVFGPPRLRSLAYDYGGFWPGLLRGWRPNYPSQPWAMFLTYSFLHGGPVHLAVNLITLASLGAAVTARVGTRGFLVLYVASILGGAAAFGLLADTLRPMVGASGALFGLAGGLLAWTYVDRYAGRLGLWPVVSAALLLMALNLVMWWAMAGQLAWETHLGGFVTGWVTALLVDPRSRDVT